MFNYLQTKVAIALLRSEKDIPSIGKAIGEKDSVIEKELKEMLKLGLVEKEGDKFRLKSEIVEELRRRRELEEQDSFKVRLKAFVEAKDYSEKAVEKHLETLATRMERDPEFRIYSIEKGEPVQQDELYSGFIEVNFSAKDFTSIIRFVLLTSPTAIEVIKPRKAEFTAFELQEGLMDLAEWVYRYASFVEKHLKREEIEKLNKSLFQGKKK